MPGTVMRKPESNRHGAARRIFIRISEEAYAKSDDVHDSEAGYKRRAKKRFCLCLLG